MDLLSLIITPVVESLMVPIKKHLGFWISSPKYVKDMEAKLRLLEELSQEVQNKRDTAMANTEVVPERAEQWLEDIKSVNERVESIPTHGIGCFNVLKRYKAGKRSSDILKEIEDLETRESKINFTKEKISLAKVPSTSKQPSTSTLVVEGKSFASRDKLFNDALESLQSTNETKKMIALCGPGGVGKTTLMEQLKNIAKDSKMFDWIVKVVVGENNHVGALQRAIAEYISVDLTETTNEVRVERLRKQFEGMSQQGKKKILIIIDDIWKAFNLKDIGLMSPLPNGFKLLLTSRFEYVCTRMGVQNNSIFRVSVLKDTEAVALFFNVVGSSSSYSDHPELQRIGEDIAKKCGGLPIALKTMADNLRGRVKDAWKEALFNLQHDDLQDLIDIVHKVFEISYTNLQREDDKAIFLLSGLFPDDFNIPVEDLMMYGWGLKLFTNVHTLAEARRRTNICVDNLIRANLLTESETIGCVKMHDLMRAFVLSNFTKVKQASIVSHDNISQMPLTNDANESYKRILFKFTDMSKFPEDFNHPDISLLVVMDGHQHVKFPQDIYERTKNIEVISFQNMSNPLLPVKFEHSSKLRTLCIRSCSFIDDDISLLGSLSNLEVLSFVNCKLSRLPSTIGNLKKLKLLDLTGCAGLYIDDGVFQNLDRLEELYMRAIKDSPIRFTKTNRDELEILSQRLFALELEFVEYEVKPKNMSFKNLERFRVSIGRQLNELDCSEEYSFRNTVKFVGDYNELLECQISNLFEKTEILCLEVNEMLYLDGHSFSNLKVLNVYNCKDLTNLFSVEVACGLKKLERLTISKCPTMRTLVAENSIASVIRFQKLNFMSLIDLPDMVVIHQLEKLDISRMENLKHIWACETVEENNISKLRKITVKECDNLMNLFPSNPLPLLNHLEEIDVEDCGSIEVLFNMNFKSVCETIECSSTKLRSIRVVNSGKLKELWRITGLTKCDIDINCFKNVERINIEDCLIFKDIFTPVTANFDLGAVTEYNVWNIGEKMNHVVAKGEISEMDESISNVTYPSYLLHKFHHLKNLILSEDKSVEEVLFEMDSHKPLLLPYLEYLYLHNLKGMNHVWKCNWNKFFILHHPPLQFPFRNLRDIQLWSCDKLKYLFSPLMAQYLSNLRDVRIVSCDGIEEVISSRDDENAPTSTPTSSNSASTLFPNLDILYLWGMRCLKSIDDQSQSGHAINGACWSLCQYPKTIEIYGCDALSVLIPWYAVGEMKRLQELKIRYCKRMVEVFESETSKDNFNVDEESAADGVVTTLTTPIPKNSPIIVAPQLSNLIHVGIYECNLLSHVFTFSALESLNQLKQLIVKECKSIQVIVKQENSRTSTKDVVFPRLESIQLEKLPKLKGFFLGMNVFRLPLLDDVTIIDCPQMMVFTSGQTKTPRLKGVIPIIHT